MSAPVHRVRESLKGATDSGGDHRGTLSRPRPRPDAPSRSELRSTPKVEALPSGLLRDKKRPSRIKPLGAEAAERVVALTLEEPPAETTHWTGALMAKAAGLSVSSVQQR
jgi:hypothetical protein